MVRRNLNTRIGKIRRNKIAFYFVIFNLCALVCMLLVSSLIEDAYAWKNKRDDVTGSDWTDWSAYDKDRDYATHDWIADFALDIIKLNPDQHVKWFDASGSDFWTPNRVKIYLYATAGPDISKVQFKSRHGQIVYGPGDVNSHKVNFDDSTKEVVLESAAVRAQLFAQYAITALNDGDCDLAAFFLGEVTHYISDISMYEHTFKKGYGSSIHSDIERHVAVRTSGRLDHDDPFVHVNREYYFNVRDAFSVTNNINVRELTIKLAYDTYFDPNHQGLYNAYNMKNMALGYGMNYDNWKHETWGKNQNEWQNFQDGRKDFINRLEESLNLAIQYVASALDWVITQMQSFQCKANNLEEVVEGTASVVYYKLTLLSVQEIVSLIGLYASLSSVSVSMTVGKFK